MSRLNAHFRQKSKKAFFLVDTPVKIDCVKHLGKLPYFWQNHEHHPFALYSYLLQHFHAMTQTHNFVVKKYELRIQIDLEAQYRSCCSPTVMDILESGVHC